VPLRSFWIKWTTAREGSLTKVPQKHKRHNEF